MNEVESYSVVSKGQLQSGYELALVQAEFASLFKIPLEQAKKIVGCKKVIKKGIDFKKASNYKERLEKIGMVVDIESNQPLQKATSFSTLALEPIEGEAEEDNQLKADQSSPESKAINTICPKCGLDQPKTNECAGCGIYIDKYRARQESVAAPASVPVPVPVPVPSVSSSLNAPAESATEEDATEGTEEEHAEVIIPKALLAAAGAALGGAIIWMLIAIIFDYELGIIAWGIGGLVGFAAAHFGSKGDYAGAICGVLALLAIVGGKYMVMESFKSQMTEDYFAESYDSSEFQEIYDADMEAAKVFVTDVNDESSLKQFMVDYGYTESDSVDQVTEEEVGIFKEYAKPNLEHYAANQPSIDDWIKTTMETFQTSIDEYSTYDLLRENFSWIDLLFYFLGISTAFKLGRGSMP